MGPATTATVSIANGYYCGPMTVVVVEAGSTATDATGVLFRDRFGQSLLLLVDAALSLTQGPPCPTPAP